MFFMFMLKVNQSPILLKDYWKLTPEFKSEIGFDFSSLPPNTGAIIIGNRALQYKSNYKYCYDLAEVWKIYTGKPFVFACWVSNVQLDLTFVEEFNKALAYGVNHIEEAVIEKPNNTKGFDALDYLKNKISYHLDDDKRKGLEKFLELMKS